ncbi:unnamed protein product [Pleuronectes platessa]|uniref:Uncharacterized protein n=1 Tax=Pleuronectes platessa TaxID=8262 RepID=A0A9N7UYT9_PLEPL|nr:unnamed protein product [Pleuronectes platessa]
MTEEHQASKGMVSIQASTWAGEPGQHRARTGQQREEHQCQQRGGAQPAQGRRNQPRQRESTRPAKEEHQANKGFSFLRCEHRPTEGGAPGQPREQHQANTQGEHQASTGRSTRPVQREEHEASTGSEHQASTWE